MEKQQRPGVCFGCEESDGCLYENINYKHQYQKQTSENEIEFEYGDSDNSNIKNRLKQNIKFWTETLKANKAIVNVLKEVSKPPLYTVSNSSYFNNNPLKYIRTLFLRQFKIF